MLRTIPLLEAPENKIKLDFRESKKINPITLGVAMSIREQSRIDLAANNELDQSRFDYPRGALAVGIWFGGSNGQQ